MSDKFTKSDFIKKVREIHEDKYDYSKVEYINSRTKIIIICLKHGEFIQKPSTHIDNKGCPRCSGRYKRTQEDFIKECDSLYKDSTIEYKHIYFNRMCDHIYPICKTHGKFKTTTDRFLNRNGGCLRCSRITNKEDFTEKSIKIHNSKYDYSKVVYNGIDKDIEIICPIHGSFYQKPNPHLCGKGCFDCGYDNKRLDREKFIEKCREIHGDKYNYSLTNYVNIKTKISIICTKHGVFEQTPHNHKLGNGCPKCNCPYNEVIISNILKSKNIKFETQKKFSGCKYIRILSFDFYIPEFNLCIEYNGEQHYRAIDHFGGIDVFNSQIKRDKIKEEYCRKNNINLEIIKFNEDLNVKIDTILLEYNSNIKINI